jgi:hypothetical protein
MPMSPFRRFKRNFILERAMTLSYIWTDGLPLIIALQAEPRPYFLITFWILRITFIFVALVFSFVRHSPRFYVPAFREMPARVYWRFVLLVVIATKALFLPRFLELPPIALLIDYSFLIIIVVSLLMAYQSQGWAANQREWRKNRIDHLSEKANLSREELEAITPILVEKGKMSQRTPWVWRFTELLVALVIGATIDAYASRIADILEQLGVHSPNVLPPY